MTGNPVKRPSGYEVPLVDKEEDCFKRWRVATNIFGVLKSVPKNWSVRVGIYGEWGEGKSTVLHFVQQMTAGSKDLVVWFNPSTAQDQNELWIQFALAFLKALEERQISIPTALAAKIKGHKHLDTLLKFSEISSIAKAIAGGGLALLSDVFAVDSEVVAKLRAAVPDNQVIVLIDDLDRADPKLVPRLLLALRELLDLPGFAYLLAFDDKMVADALADYHSAWGTGHEFLEKILDFTYRLEIPTPTQKALMLDRELARHCQFIDREVARALEDLIPSNPRKIKLLIRSLSLMRAEVERHDPDELEWNSVIIAQLIRLESEAFLRSLLESDLLLQSFLPPRPKPVLSPEKKEQEPTIEEKLRKLAEKTGGKEVERLIALANAWTARTNVYDLERLGYQATFAAQPHAITWKEFRTFFESWNRERHTPVEGWIQTHAEQRQESLADVASELFRTTLYYRRYLLEQASNAVGLQEQETHMKDAAACLDLVSMFVLQGLPSLGETAFRSVDYFKQLFETADHWAHFYTNPLDKAARNAERALLRQFVQLSCLNPEPLAEYLQPWNPHPRVFEATIDLRAELVRQLERPLAEKAVKVFHHEGGTRKLVEIERNQSLRYVLLRPDSLVWKAPLRRLMYQTLSAAQQDLIVYRNAYDFLELVTGAAEKGYDVVSSDEAQALLTGSDLYARLWRSVIARRAQFRFLEPMRSLRKRLVKLGGEEHRLKIPSWLVDHSGAGS